MNKAFIMISLAVMASACMYKPVLTGEADDIMKAEIYNFDSKNYLVMSELIYQATSKSGGRGITTITGFNEMRMSVYDLEDGSLSARKKTGRQNRDPLLFLGCTPGNLWLYNATEAIHSLDPETLEMKTSMEKIYEINPELRGNLASCEWYQYGTYYQFNSVKQQIILTDNKGYRHILDPATLQSSRIEWEYRSFDSRPDRLLETHISFPPPVTSISGDIRKQLRINNREVSPGLTFLDGKIIIDRNPVRQVEGIHIRLYGNMMKLETIYPKIMDLNAMNDGRGPLWRTPLRDTLTALENLKRTLESEIQIMETAMTDISSEGFSHRYTVPLSPDTTTFFLLHASGTEKEANLMISRIMRKGNQELTELWSTEIPGIFFNPVAARETNVYKEIFSKGSPEFDFKSINLEDDKLILIWMLHGICLNINNGEILWKFRI